MARSAKRSERIVLDPKVLVGKPVVRGTRIGVAHVLERLALDLDVDGLIADYPRLTREDVKACLEYAESLVNGESLFPEVVKPARPKRAS